jgi:hypothetical protein
MQNPGSYIRKLWEKKKEKRLPYGSEGERQQLLFGSFSPASAAYVYLQRHIVSAVKPERQAIKRQKRKRVEKGERGWDAEGTEEGAER